jgi:hypothetical protein
MELLIALIGAVILVEGAFIFYRRLAIDPTSGRSKYVIPGIPIVVAIYFVVQAIVNFVR